MTVETLSQQAERLAARIAEADAAERLELQPEFSNLLTRMELLGEQISADLRRLDLELSEEMVEARADNLPV